MLDLRKLAANGIYTFSFSPCIAVSIGAPIHHITTPIEAQCAMHRNTILIHIYLYILLYICRLLLHVATQMIFKFILVRRAIDFLCSTCDFADWMRPVMNVCVFVHVTRGSMLFIDSYWKIAIFASINVQNNERFTLWILYSESRVTNSMCYFCCALI